MSKSPLAQSCSFPPNRRAFTPSHCPLHFASIAFRLRAIAIALVAMLALGAVSAAAQTRDKDKDKDSKKSSTRSSTQKDSKSSTRPTASSASTNQMVGVKFLGLSVVQQPADTGELVLSVDYQYDGAAGATVQLVPVVGRTRSNPPEFKSDEVNVSQGKGRATLKIAYVPETPKSMTTDTITVWAFARGARTIPSVRPFPQAISWGRKASVETAKAAPTTETGDAPPATTDAPPTPPAKVAAVPKAERPPPERVAPAPKPAAESEPPPPTGTLSATQVGNRPAWLQRLTLGPGDSINISLYGEPELSVMEATIAPDGRISYLEAQDVLAAGLTVDEFRQKLDEELGKYRRGPRTMISPVAFNSKKFFVLGHVVERGVFTLDRPLTIVEAVAQARGLEIGMRDGRMAELADFSRSFLARGGQRMEVNFEKLFLEGDLSQNTLLEPGDYLYFPPSTTREVYVLGEVTRPGIAAFNTDGGALTAITERGGFTPRAWNRKVLVVRGSLDRPETFIVDARAVLSARQPDFPLRPRDIIFVSARPWIRAEELLDEAATAFIQGVVITWTGSNVGTVLR